MFFITIKIWGIHCFQTYPEQAHKSIGKKINGKLVKKTTNWSNWSGIIIRNCVDQDPHPHNKAWLTFQASLKPPELPTEWNFFLYITFTVFARALHNLDQVAAFRENRMSNLSFVYGRDACCCSQRSQIRISVLLELAILINHRSQAQDANIC